MNNDDFEKYYESKEANEDSKSDANVILFCYSICNCYDLLVVDNKKLFGLHFIAESSLIVSI